MIKQIPAFDTEYFKIGEAVEIMELLNLKTYDALIKSISNDVIQVVKIQYHYPMTGTPGYETRTENIYIDKVVNNQIKITKYNKE